MVHVHTPTEDSEEVYNEKNAKMSRRHQHSHHGKDKKGSKHNHNHKHSHKHHNVTKTDDSDHKMDEGGVHNLTENNEMSNIYDSPKVPPIPVVMNNSAEGM